MLELLHCVRPLVTSHAKPPNGACSCHMASAAGMPLLRAATVQVEETKCITPFMNCLLQATFTLLPTNRVI